MAHVLYALNGQGRGHRSRSLAVAGALRERGHAVTFCCGGEAADALRADGEDVLEVPAPREVVRGNRVRLLASARHNAPLAVGTPRIVEGLAERVRAVGPDLVISDFEPFAPRAAARLGLPCVALDHQHVLTEAACRVPARYAASAALTRLGIGMMAPRRLFDRLVVPTFFFPPLRPGSRTALVPPILRPDVLAAEPEAGAHVLVYVNHPAGMDGFADALRAVDAPFVLYNVPAPERPEAYPNLTFRPPDRAAFVRDLARCRAVICTAGFTLLSEALHLGKPVLALPNRGFFEQALNALHLRRSGRGDAVLGRALRAEDVRRFLDLYRPGPGERAHGNTLAVEHVEAALMRRRPSPAGSLSRA